MLRDGSQVFHATAAEAGMPLSAALRQWLKHSTGQEARRMISGQRVQIDGNLCQDARRRLKTGEVVKVLAHAVAVPPEERDIHIRFLDENIVVVEKPAGLTTLRHADEVHWSGRRRRRQPTLDDLLPNVIAAKLVRSRGVRHPRELRVIPVHRLDRETSGLMVFARTAAAERKLVEQFREHELSRAYWAIVLGHVGAQTIESRLVRDRGDGKRGSTAEPEAGQRAVTHVRPLEQLADYTLVECRLETGRTHQIRIHLSESGHPVCGDKEYRGPFPGKPLIDRSGAPRLALHAAELGFEHPLTREALSFRSRLPRELSEFLARLRKSGTKT